MVNLSIIVYGFRLFKKIADRYSKQAACDI